MSILRKIKKQRVSRKFRVRNKIDRVNTLGHKVVVFKSNRHMYATLVDVVSGKSLCGYSSLNLSGEASSNKKTAELVGSQIAKMCLEKGIKKVVFDRGGCLYHGRIAALADAMRSAGIEV